MLNIPSLYATGDFVLPGNGRIKVKAYNKIAYVTISDED